MMVFMDLHNALRVLMNIDRPEFEQAINEAQAAIPASERDTPEEQWPRFRDDPHSWFISAPTAQAKAIWRIVEVRSL